MKLSVSRRFFVRAIAAASTLSLFKLNTVLTHTEKLTLKRSFIMKDGRALNIKEFDNYVFQYLDQKKIRQFNNQMHQNGSISSFQRFDEIDRVVFLIQFKNQEALQAYNKNLSYLLKERNQFLSGPFYIENIIV